MQQTSRRTIPTTTTQKLSLLKLTASPEQVEEREGEGAAGADDEGAASPPPANEGGE